MSTKTVQEIEAERIDTLILRDEIIDEIKNLVDEEAVREYIKFQVQLVQIHMHLEKLDEELIAT